MEGLLPSLTESARPGRVDNYYHLTLPGASHSGRSGPKSPGIFE